MHKDELLQLHSLLCQMKRSLVEEELAEPALFQEYEDLEVSPQHIHKSKTEHKKAVFLLSQGLTDLFLQHNEAQRDKLRDRFSRLAAGKKMQPTNPRPSPLNRNEPPSTFAAIRASA